MAACVIGSLGFFVAGFLSLSFMRCISYHLCLMGPIILNIIRRIDGALSFAAFNLYVPSYAIGTSMPLVLHYDYDAKYRSYLRRICPCWWWTIIHSIVDGILRYISIKLSQDYLPENK